MALRELLAKFGFDVDTKPLKKGDKDAKSFEEKIGALGAAFAGAALVGGVTAFTQSLVNVGSELDDQSNRLGLSAESLQAWRFAAQQGGTSAEDLSVGLRTLTRQLAEAASGNEAAEKEFSKLGLSLRENGKVKDATAVIGEIADKMQAAKSNTEQAGIALKFFGRSGLSFVPLLKDGSKGVQQLMDRFKELGGGFSNEFVKAADAAGDAQVELGVATDTLKSKIGVALLPMVLSVVNKLTDLAIWFRKVTDGTTAFHSALGILGTASVLTGVKLATGIAQKFGVIKTVAEGATGGVLGTAKSFFELASAGAKMGLQLGAVYLVLDDLYALFTGGKSVIGDFIDKVWGVGASAEFVATLKQAFFDVKDAIKAAVPPLQELIGFFKELIGYLKITWGFLTKWPKLSKAWEDLKTKSFSDIAEESSVSYNKDAAEATARQKGQSMIDGQYINGASEAVGPNGKPLISVPAGGNGQPVQQNNNTTIQVNGAGDPGVVAKKVADVQAAVQSANQSALRAMQRP